MTQELYIPVTNGEPSGPSRPRPFWVYDDGTPVSDTATFVREGMYPVIDNKPSFNEKTQYITQNDWRLWTVFSNYVEPTYTIHEKGINKVKAEYKEAINNKYKQRLNFGFVYDFGNKSATRPDGSTEPAGFRMLQTREQDRERWSATMQVAQQYISSGVPNEPMRSFRTEDNCQIPMTAQDVVNCLNAMQAYFGRCLDQMWVHKDAVNSKATPDEVAAYDITVGWPTNEVI